MAIPAKHRWLFYLAALLFTVAAVRFAGGEDREASAVVAPAVVAPAAEQAATARRARARCPICSSISSSGAHTQNRMATRSARNRGRKWRAKRRARTRHRRKPTKPQAPPLPFVYMGKLVDDGETIVFLTKENRNYILRQGDTIDGVYRVDKIDERAVSLTYLPLKIKQTLALGGEN